MAVTESWGRPELADGLISQPGYDLFRQDRCERHGGGVFILVKSKLRPADFSLSNDNVSFQDSVWCSIIYSQTISLLIGCIYRSPTSTSSNDTALCSVMSRACASFNGIKIILGDFNCPNVDWRHPSTHCSSHFLVECSNDNFLHQMVTEPTRGDNILDLVFTDDSSCVRRTSVTDPFPGSDHLSVTVEVAFDRACDRQNEKTSTRYFEVLDYSNADWIAYQTLLSDMDIDDLFSSENIDEIWDSIKKYILQAATRCIPTRKHFNTIYGAPLKGEVLRAFRARKRVRQQTRDSSSALAMSLRDRVERRLQQAIKESRNRHERKIADACRTDVRKFWKYVRLSLASRPRITRVLMEDGSLSKDDKETAESFNTFFASVFTQEDVEPPNIPLRTSHMMCTVDITYDEVAKAVRGRANGSAPGPDGFTYELFKEGGSAIIFMLTRFFRLLLSKGTLPTEWKLAHVVPIHKKGSKSKCENYRPVSLTCVACKILEVIITKAILKYFLQNKLIKTTQHGFLPKKSSTTALLEYMEDLLAALDEGESTDVLYLDFRKAFDSVPHKHLIAKLKSYGLEEPLINWIRSFLVDRQQLVKIRASISQKVGVSSGVPQGSILGPLLFVIYINDIDEIIENSSIIKYADDVRLYMSFPSVITTNIGPNLIFDDFLRVLSWSKTWLLNLNFTKCKCIHFGHRNPRHDYFSDNFALTEVNKEVDLGVLVTSNLKPSAQCLRVAARANKILGCIKLAFKNLDSYTLSTLYKALVLPILEYCSVVWCPFYVQDIEVLEKVQRRMTRFLPCLRDLPYEQRLKSLDLLTLHARRIKHDLILTYKIFHGMVELDPCKFFMPANDRRTRGHNFKIFRCFSRLVTRRGFFSQRVPHYWNDLPAACVNAPSLSAFKTALSVYFEDNGIH